MIRLARRSSETLAAEGGKGFCDKARIGCVASRAVRAVVARDATDMLGDDRRVRLRSPTCDAAAAAASASDPLAEPSSSSSPSANNAVRVSPKVSSVVGALRFSVKNESERHFH